MKSNLKQSPNYRSSRLRYFVNYVCIPLLACASLSVQAERIRHCILSLSTAPSVSGSDYNGDTISYFPAVTSAVAYTSGRHGGIQANTARKRAVSRFKKCAQELVNKPNKNANNIHECDNAKVGSNRRDMADIMGNRSMTDKLICRFASNDFIAGTDNTFFIKATKFNVFGKTSGNNFCGSTVNKSNNKVADQDISLWNCNDRYYDTYSLKDAINSPRYDFEAPFVAVMNGVLSIREILRSKSDVEKIFGEGHQVKADKLLTILEDAAINKNTETLVEWLPNLSVYDGNDAKVELAINGTTPLVTSDLPLQAAYSRPDNALLMSDRIMFESQNEDLARCAMVQTLAHHVSHYFDDFNGITEDLKGAEGRLAALRICNRPLFNSLTDNQIAALQTELDSGDVLFHGKYNVNNIELAFEIDSYEVPN